MLVMDATGAGDQIYDDLSASEPRRQRRSLSVECGPRGGLRRRVNRGRRGAQNAAALRAWAWMKTDYEKRAEEARGRRKRTGFRFDGSALIRVSAANVYKFARIGPCT